MRKHARLIVLLVALAMALSACGGGTPAPAATTAAAATEAATTAAAAAATEAATTTAAGTTAAGAAATTAAAAATVAATTPQAAPAQIEEDLPFVSLYYFFTGSDQDDLPLVQAAMDEYFMERLNCTVTLTPIPGGEWSTRVPMLFSAGEQIDLIFDQSNRGYYTNVANGAYHPLNDLFAQYAPDAMAHMAVNAPGIIDAPKVAGELYGVPCQKQTPQSEAWYYRKDIADAIGMDVDSLVTLQDLEPYLIKIQESYPEMTPYYLSSSSGINMEWATDAIRDNPYRYEELTGAITLLIVDLEENKVLNHFETEWDLDRFETLKRWQDMGLINPDAATTTTGGGDMFRAGKTWFIGAGGSPTTLSQMQTSYGTDFYRWRCTPPIVNTYQNVTALTCIPQSSIDKERAMMVINLFHSDPVIINLFNSGIEGKHHVIDENGRFALPEGVTTKGETGYAFGFETFFGNMFLNTLWYNETEDRYDELREYNFESRQSKIMGFYVNMENITTEYAAVESVRVQYVPILKAGVSPNVAETLREMNEKMYANGLQKVIDDAQRQYDEFIAANNMRVD
ncbi:MAG: ABC transporter substrate-binding protein [Oscillospiraceae bacterium]|nr:ABC transporter substrate-binding protein [Oscillospiraceae bacterium]